MKLICSKATLFLVVFTTYVSADEGAGAVELHRGRPMIVRSVLPTDCRVVRGFTHGPVDGREDTRYSNGVVGEWTGLTGSPAVNYRVFNGNNGLHLTLPDGGLHVLQLRGDWRGKVYLNSDSLIEPKVKPLCEIPLRKALAHQADARRLSFFYSEGQTGALKQVSLFRVESGSLRGDLQEVATRGKCVTPVEMSAPWKDWMNGVAAVTLKMRVENAKAGAVVTVRVGDVLDARRKAVIVDLRVPGRGGIPSRSIFRIRSICRQRRSGSRPRDWTEQSRRIRRLMFRLSLLTVSRLNRSHYWLTAFLARRHCLKPSRGGSFCCAGCSQR